MLIDVPDEMGAALLELAKEYATQDNCGQAAPMYFSVEVKEEVGKPEGCGWFQKWCDSEGDVADTEEKLFEYIKEYNEDDLPTDWDELDSDDKLEWVSENMPDIRLVDYDLEPKYYECFFTKKGCEAHIAMNGHNYSNTPRPYANTFWRNPDMKLIADFLTALHNNTKETT